MKAVIAVLVGLVAFAMADECGPLQRLKIKQQWAKAYGEGQEREFLGISIWKAFFKLEPNARKFFSGVGGDDIHSGKFQAHSTRVLAGVDLCISVLDSEAVLIQILTHLAGQHKERGISGNYFDTFGDVLMEVIPAQLGRCFDEHAWRACYKVIKNGIQGK